MTSSTPPELDEKQTELFREVLTLLNDKKIPYAVSGAFALQEHTGICRFTKDLDVFLTDASAERALGFLREEGFDCETCDPVWLFKTRRDEFFVDLITGMSNGTIAVEDTWIERAKPAMVYDVPTKVLAPEELIASKLFVTRRERFDGADIVHVIYGTKERLDWDRILALAGDHWEMLLWALVLFRYVYPGQTRYVPDRIWNDLLNRFQNAVKNPERAAKFRGSLVDDKMFAIDVNEWGLENMLEDYRASRLSQIAEQRKKQ